MPCGSTPCWKSVSTFTELSNVYAFRQSSRSVTGGPAQRSGTKRTTGRPRKHDTLLCWGGTGGGGGGVWPTCTHTLHSLNPLGKTHLLILPETLSVLSFFLNILGGFGGSRRGPTKIFHSLLYSLVSVFLTLWLALRLSSYCGPSQTHSKTQAHTHVSTVAAPPRQVNRCVTAPTST